MKKLFLILFFQQIYCQNTVNYIESTDIIANQERGFQKYSITDANYYSQTNYTNIDDNYYISLRTGNEKITVLFRYFLLANYLNSNISQTYLNNIQLDFDKIRSAGIKCIVRFSYSNIESPTAIQQPTKSQILTHINQLAPILETNKDIIVSHQAGFIGTYGEWYYTNSSEFGTNGNINMVQWQNRKDVVDAMLNATPLSIPLQVRYVGIKKTMYGTIPLDNATAYQNTPQARIGFYNDAFLNDYGDQGTYEVTGQYTNPVGTPDYIFLSNETKYLPMSGETNGLNPPRTDGTNAVIELNATNWSMINRDYFEQVITNWTNSGHLNTILKNIGYRMVLQNSTFNLEGNNLNYSINIENKGYANPYLFRNVYLVLRNETTSINQPFLLNTDFRTWQTTVNLSGNLDLSNLQNGNYTSYLYLPDVSPSISNRPEYSIAFANTNVWSGITGFNSLNQNFNLQVLNNENFSNTNSILYPNPFINVINLFEINNFERIEIFDVYGKLIYQNKDKNLKTISTLNWPKGIYFAKIFFEDKTYKNNKLLKM